jgi:hypothetical protein
MFSTLCFIIIFFQIIIIKKLIKKLTNRTFGFLFFFWKNRVCCLQYLSKALPSMLEELRCMCSSTKLLVKYERKDFGLCPLSVGTVPVRIEMLVFFVMCETRAPISTRTDPNQIQIHKKRVCAQNFHYSPNRNEDEEKW